MSHDFIVYSFMLMLPPGIMTDWGDINSDDSELFDLKLDINLYMIL